ncbi:hypothetical protein ACVW1A_000019 [Bradyrhizobium sp. LB1.3]
MTQFICTGHDTVAGCGAILTDEEHRYYGVCWQNCEQE